MLRDAGAVSLDQRKSDRSLKSSISSKRHGAGE